MGEFLAILANAAAKHGWAALFLLLVCVLSFNILPGYVSRLVSVEKDTYYMQKEIVALTHSLDNLHDDTTALNASMQNIDSTLGKLQGTLDYIAGHDNIKLPRSDK
jgi:hypothetical protein